MARCSYCRGEAVYLRRYSGESLCRGCFVSSIVKRVRSTISHHKMFSPEEHIAVAVSGGKDSVSLLHILSEIEEGFPRSKISAILVDEGIEGYREEAIEVARENCEMLKIPLHIYSFEEIYGRSLDDVAEAAETRGRLTTCSYCGVLRRKALNLASKKIKASKLALAHNLDDEAQSMVLSLLRGDLAALARVRPVLEKMEGFVQRVKPLSEIPEREIAFYAHLKGVRFQTIPCPYLESSMRSDIRRFLNRLEEKHPGIKYNVYRTIEKIQQHLEGVLVRGVRGNCKICGEPSTGDICGACRSLKELGLASR